MIPVPPYDVDSLPNAEWHGGVAKLEFKARGVSQGVQTLSPSLTLRATKSTLRSVLLWLALWMLPLLPVMLGFVLTADDLGAYHLPLRAYYQSALQAGENWTWCPWIFGGYHLHGEGQIGGDHPLHQLLYRALPLHWAFGLECWWAYPATFFGMWWWLRQMRLSTGASQVAALAFSLCGFMTLRVVHTNAVQVIAHLPWLLGCLTWLEQRARRSTSLRSLLPPVACSGLLTGSQLLLGYPQYVVFTLIAESLWLGSLMIRWPRERRTLALGWIAAKAIGLLLGASQVLPTLEYLSLSDRMNWTSQQMFEGSWPLLNLWQLVAPYLFTNRVVGQNTHELTIFVGIVPVCLAMLGLVNRPRRPLRTVKRFAVTLCAAGLLLALGDMSPFAEFMPYVPVWNRFRFPCRATLLLCLGIALLAALGCQRLLQLARHFSNCNNLDRVNNSFSLNERRWLVGLILLSILVPLYGLAFWGEYLKPWPFVIIGPVSVLLSCLILNSISRNRAERFLIPLLVGIELLAYASSHTHWQTLSAVKWNIDHNENHAGNPIPRDYDAKYLCTSNSLGCNLNIAPHLLQPYSKCAHRLDSFAQINGYVGVAPKRELIYDEAHPAALAAAGVTHKYTLQSIYKLEETTPLSHDTLPRGSLVTKTELTMQPTSRIEQLDLREAALIASDLHLSATSPNDHLQIQLTADRPGHLTFALETNRDALLVTTESYHPGWQARIDGNDVPVLRVNGDFLGVRIPATAQQVECYFSDNWHAVGRWISLGSLGLLGLVFCLTRWRATAPGFVR